MKRLYLIRNTQVVDNRDSINRPSGFVNWITDTPDLSDQDLDDGDLIVCHE